jgi:hypothetical protein
LNSKNKQYIVRKTSIIKEQVFKTGISSHDQAEFVFEQINSLLRSKLPELLENFVEGIEPKDSVLVIERISLDLGGLDKDDFEAQLLAQLDQQLEQYKNEHFQVPPEKIKKPEKHPIWKRKNRKE